ncbi:MAG: hypothetical protein H0T79_04660, partial [Deltaproteobacteria bacterium]|nr:hypothetical protein [Deltaproteobacteria bacterium]
MNAVVYMAERLAPAAVRRVAALPVRRFEPAAEDAVGVARSALDTAAAIERVVARWSGDLCGFLNALM